IGGGAQLSMIAAAGVILQPHVGTLATNERGPIRELEALSLVRPLQDQQCDHGPILNATGPRSDMIRPVRSWGSQPAPVAGRPAITSGFRTTMSGKLR